jgi:hypothetical protein
MSFVSCRFSFDLRVDGAGRAWIASFGIEGVSPCLDLVQCIEIEQSRIPWRGRIVASGGGSLRLRVEDFCVESCFGRFKGSWELALTRSDRGWRTRSAGMIGSSGLRVDGVVGTRGKAIDVNVAASEEERCWWIGSGGESRPSVLWCWWWPGWRWARAAARRTRRGLR